MKRIKGTYAIKTGRIIAGILAFGMVFYGISIGLRYLYAEEYQQSRVLWHDYYGQEDNIDNLCLGSSHVYQGINPFILEDLSGDNYFDFATGSQSLKASYYCLREAVKKHKISHVYLEMFYSIHVDPRGDYSNKASVLSNWRCTDYMQPSLNKLDFLFSMRDTEYFGDTLFPFLRFRNYLFDYQWVERMVKTKQQDEYKNFEFSNVYAVYEGKGYYRTTRRMTEEDLRLHRDTFPYQMSITEDAELYLRKIIEFCQEEGIRIVLFSSPMHDLRLVSTENYDGYIDSIKAITEEYEGVLYYDFNLSKPEYFQWNNLGLFYNNDHLNEDGAAVFTTFFYKVVSGKPEENQEYFYSSYAEKLAMTSPTVYGIYYNSNTYVASNRDKGLEYRITKIPEGEKEVLIQDFSENKEFFLPPEEHGMCIIWWRGEGTTGTRILRIKY